MPPLREMLSVASPTPPPPTEGGSSELYFFAVTIAAVSVVLVVSNVIAFSCCSSCYPVDALRRLLGTRRHWAECSYGSPVPQGIPGIPTCKYRKEQRPDIECSVCLSAFVDGEDVRHLPICKHSFHAHCIDMWLHSHSNCPLCRANISAVPDSRGLQHEQGDMAAVVVVA